MHRQDHAATADSERTKTTSTPVRLDPIDQLAQEHERQLDLCTALETIADSLPDRVNRRLVHDVITILAHGLTPHYRFEEDVLFPLLRKRAANDGAMIAALDQLEHEHGRDTDLSDELGEELHGLDVHGQARNVEMLAYMLRGYFEGQRRHIEWENRIVLPAARRHLTAEDLGDLGERLERRPNKPALLAALPSIVGLRDRGA